MHSCQLSHKYEQFFKATFQGQKHVWTKCAQIGYEKKIINCPFALLLINVKILFNFQKEWCTFGRKKGGWRKKECLFLKFQCFEYAKNIFDLCQALNM